MMVSCSSVEIVNFCCNLAQFEARMECASFYKLCSYFCARLIVVHVQEGSLPVHLTVLVQLRSGHRDGAVWRGDAELVVSRRVDVRDLEHLARVDALLEDTLVPPHIEFGRHRRGSHGRSQHIAIWHQGATKGEGKPVRALVHRVAQRGVVVVIAEETAFHGGTAVVQGQV
eukprot:1514915-Prymnesium_polylepis.1